MDIIIKTTHKELPMILDLLSDSETYIESPIKNGALDLDIIENPNTYLAKNSGIMGKYSMWEQERLKKIQGIEDDTGASFWTYVRNAAIALCRGGVQFLDDTFDATLYAGAVTYNMARTFASTPRERRQMRHTRDKTTETLMAFAALDPLQNELKSWYKDTNAAGMGILTSVFEGVGYYGTSFYLGGKASQGFKKSYISNNPTSLVDPKQLRGYTLYDNLPGGISAAGKTFGNVSESGIKERDISKYSEIALFEAPYSAISYMLQYCGAKLISNSSSTNTVKYTEDGFSVVDNDAIGNMLGYTIKMSAPYINEKIYSTYEGREFDAESVRKQTLEAFVSQTMSIGTGKAGEWLGKIKQKIKVKIGKIKIKQVCCCP